MAIVGDSFQRKSELAIDMMCGLLASHPEEERGLDVVYVSVGKSQEECFRLEDLLHRSGAIDWTTVIRATDRDTMGMQYLSVYAGLAIADFHRARGRHVLFVCDSLSNHNNIAAKLNREGRSQTAYGNWYGDMLDRSGLYKKEYGGGSITQIHVADPRDDRAETMYYFLPHLTGAVDTVVPMTTETYEKGIFPAISLIPVPFGTPLHQRGALRSLTARIRTKIVNAVGNHKQALAQQDAGFDFEDLDLEEDETYVELLKIRRTFTQTRATSLADTIIVMMAISDTGFLERVHLGKLHLLEPRILEYFAESDREEIRNVMETLDNMSDQDELSEDLEFDLKRALDLFLVDNDDLGDYTDLVPV